MIIKKSTRWRAGISLILASIAVGELFLLIYRHAELVKISFKNQRLEKHYQSFVKERQKLQESIVEATNKEVIKEYASKNLQMKSIKLSQIRSVPI